MGSVEKRVRRLPDGSPGPVRWRARYRDVHGRTRSRTFTRKLDAERFLERNGGHTDPSLTLRVYGHLFEGVQEELTEALDRRREAAAGRDTGQVIGLPPRRRKNAGGEP